MQSARMDGIVCLEICAIKLRREYSDRSHFLFECGHFLIVTCDGELTTKDDWNVRNDEQDYCKGDSLPNPKAIGWKL